MATLRGVGVLVTRPAEQAMTLCRLLEARGAHTFVLPGVEITPLGAAEMRALAARVQPLAHFDLIIFTSANAVRHGVGLLAGHVDLPLAAIGPATARALVEAGHRVAVQPAGGFDTESLLRHPRLEAVSGHAVLLVKGLHGRVLLADELERRGASLTLAAVYRREPPQPQPAVLAALEAHFAAGQIQAVTATSAEIAQNLLELATPALRGSFEQVHWVVPGARVAQSLRARGSSAPVLVAASAEDHDLVDAIERWRSRASGA